MVSTWSAEGSRYEPATIPAGGRAASITLSLVTTNVIAVCIFRRLVGQQSWKSMPLTRWLVLLIYFDSFLFVFTAAIISQGLGLNNSLHLCAGAVLLCLVCYMTTKMIYLFLVERARIVRSTRKPRMKDRLYVFNTFGMLIPYVVIIVLNLLYRFAYINEKGMCIIGLKPLAVVPLLAFDVVANVYLTILFLVPLCNLHSYRQNLNPALQKTAFRAFIGACVTLASSVANLLTITILKGEPGWICLICCNSDILFSVLVLQWITNGDSAALSQSWANPSIEHTQRGVSGVRESLGLPVSLDMGERLKASEIGVIAPASDRSVEPSVQGISEKEG